MAYIYYVPAPQLRVVTVVVVECHRPRPRGVEHSTASLTQCLPLHSVSTEVARTAILGRGKDNERAFAVVSCGRSLYP